MNKIFFIPALISMTMVTQLYAQPNVVRLKINTNDYKKHNINDGRDAKYKFDSDAEFSLNGEEYIKIEQMQTRGQSSIKAPRRNLSINLVEKTKGSHKDENNKKEITGKKFLMTSMWIDKGYISSVLGLRVMDLLNIGESIEPHYTELKFVVKGEDGKEKEESRGIYMITKKPAAAADSPYFIRRGYNKFLYKEAKTDIKDIVEIKGFKPEQEKEIAAEKAKIENEFKSIYAALKTKSGKDLFNYLESKFDVEGYMKLIAVSSLFKNGDGADEVYMYLDRDAYKEGRYYFRTLPWDFDDLFKEMHNSNANTMAKTKYKTTLVYNFEDPLDAKFREDSYLYSKLREKFEDLLAPEGQLSEKNINAVIDQQVKELSEYFSNSEALAMAKLDVGRGGKAYTGEEIIKISEQRKVEIKKRRAELLNIIQIEKSNLQ